MHAALGIPELLDLIFESFSEPEASDLLKCALVSKSWSNATIRILWRGTQCEAPRVAWYDIIKSISRMVRSELAVSFYLVPIVPTS
jgi:hypothetical protein